MNGRTVRGLWLLGLLWLGLLACLLAAPAMAHDTVYYYYTDSLHSAVVETDAQGQVLERTYYGPYGLVLDRSLRDGPGYSGHEEDPATGLNYLQQRYYDPQAGRFLSADPVQATEGGGNFNRYWYANDNPYRYTDPFGLQTTGEAIDAAAEGCGPVSCAGWAILKAVYTATGAEAVSRVTDKGWSASSTSEKVKAAIAVAAVLPVGRALEGVEGLARGADAAKATTEGAEAARGAAAAGTRTATTAFGRSVQSLKDTLASGAGPWQQVSAHVERATAKAYEGGTSMEQIFVNGETGQRIVRHTVVRDDKILHETFRPYSKFGKD